MISLVFSFRFFLSFLNFPVYCCCCLVYGLISYPVCWQGIAFSNILAFAVDVHEKKTHLSFEIEDFVETQLCQLRVVLAILAILPSRMLQLVHDLVKGTVRWLCLVSNMAITELVFR